MEIDINNVNKIENPDELFRILAEMVEYLRSKMDVFGIESKLMTQ